MSLRVLSIFGTRPEAVKMVPVVQALARTPGIDSLVCITAQHRQMLDQVLELFNIQPDIDLDLMQPAQSLAESAAAIFTHLPPVLMKFQPDWVLIQGDTTTVMASALLAYYHHIKVGHVEAGLRTHNKWQPFPEEINRRVAGVIADLHFAPTEWSQNNLLNEGISANNVVITGNPVIDALQQICQMKPDRIYRDLLRQIGIHEKPNNSDPRLVLVTAHRRENFGKPLEEICAALRHLAEWYGNKIRLVYPVHLNPNVQETVYRLLGNIPQITLLPPMDYLPFIQLLKRSTLILTDSGGIQEEAPGLGVPVLILRQVTERPEGIQAGAVRLVGNDQESIVAETRRLLDDPQAHAEMAQAENPYGDGHAAERIVKAILNYPRM